MTKTADTKVISPRAILSYPTFKEPKQDRDDDGNPKGKPKFSGTFIFTAGTDLSALKKAAISAAETKWPGKVQAMIESSRKNVSEGGSVTFRMPFRTDVSAKGYPEGSTFINARTEQRPGMVYAHEGEVKGKPAQVPLDKVEEVFYPGAIVRASLVAFAYDNKGNRGVGFALNNVQKLAEGERLDSRVAAENEFDVDLSKAPVDLDALV